MGFREEIEAVAQKARPYASGDLDERNTESVLVEPFIRTLGYDLGNPAEVNRQLPAAYSGRGKKVDFAIMQGSVPIMLFECKRVGLLSRQRSVLASAEQLSRYFNNTKTARFGVLTDGLLYYFFSDLETANVMDKSPFHILDLRKADSASIDASLPLLDQFRKPNFDSQRIVLSIRQEKAIRELLRNELVEPTPKGLLRFVADRLPEELFPWQKNEPRLNSIKPVVKQVLAGITNSATINEDARLPLNLRDWKTIDNWVTNYAPNLKPDAHSPTFRRFHAQELEQISTLHGANAWSGTDRLALFEIQRNMKKSHLVISLVIGPGDEGTKARFYELTRRAKHKGFFRRVNRETRWMHIYRKVLFSWSGLDSSNAAQLESAAAIAIQKWYSSDYQRLIQSINDELGS